MPRASSDGRRRSARGRPFPRGTGSVARSPVAVMPPILLAMTATDLIPVLPACSRRPDDGSPEPIRACPHHSGDTVRPGDCAGRRELRVPALEKRFGAAPPGSRTAPSYRVGRVDDVSDDAGVRRSGDAPGGSPIASGVVRRAALSGEQHLAAAASGRGRQSDLDRPGRPMGAATHALRRGGGPGVVEVGLPDDGQGGPSAPVLVPAVARIGWYRRESRPADEHGDDTGGPWRTGSTTWSAGSEGHGQDS